MKMTKETMEGTELSNQESIKTLGAKGNIAMSEMVNCLALYFLRQQMNYETIL